MECPTEVGDGTCVDVKPLRENFFKWHLRNTILPSALLLGTAAALSLLAPILYTLTTRWDLLNQHLKVLEPADKLIDTYQYHSDEMYIEKLVNTPYLTYMDEQGYLCLNKTGFEAGSIIQTEVQCKYNIISGLDDENDVLERGPDIYFSE